MEDNKENKENKEMNINMHMPAMQPAMQPTMMPPMIPTMPMVPMICCPCVMSMQCPMMYSQNMMGMPPTAVSPYEMNQPMANPFAAAPFMGGPNMNSGMYDSMSGAQY